MDCQGQSLPERPITFMQPYIENIKVCFACPTVTEGSIKNHVCIIETWPAKE